MKIFEFTSLSIFLFFILVSCVSCVVSSYHGVVSTIKPQQPLKFYMQPRHRKIPIFEIENDDLRANGTPNRNSIAMLVNISFGDPPVPQLLIMDTASDLIWVQCAFCTTCFEQTTTRYDSSKSKTYQDVGCDSAFCQTPLQCNVLTGICIYSIRYVGQSGTKGMLGTDQLSFKTSGDTTITGGDIVFGCGTENIVLPHHADFGSGILGLSAGTLSLTSQKGRQFSYCIGNVYDHSYPYNQLIIGDGAIFRGYNATLEVFNDNYYVTMKGITVGDKFLNIDPEVFVKPPSSDGGMIIDSGTTYTFLPKGAYEALKEEVILLVGSSWRRNTINEDDLCFWTFLNNTGGFPTVIFHLDYADIRVPPSSFFTQNNWFTTCIAVKPTKLSHGMIGLLAQQNYNFGFDLEHKKLFIENVDCEKI